MTEVCNSDLENVVLEDTSADTVEGRGRHKRRLKKVLHFSDGDLEEYSEDETDTGILDNQVALVNPASLEWVPWIWYQTMRASSKVLDGCDYMGEWLADILGITSPKYEFEINEYLRMQAAEAEEKKREDLEMGGWNDQNRNNLIVNNTAETEIKTT
ncbi:protein FAM177A1 isoform X2 [Orussus abietinus]|uniref:protein FAM177A1 isoform X1 n=1 Tax=Orussus abietinus TaxID=222816 RepID=UPI000625090E|nr:protein FAM177A1 isoform X1 [Orussus abietinus]XP_012278556.1 protein FAM177A1 isoform X2 [Orussus abietinus]